MTTPDDGLVVRHEGEPPSTPPPPFRRRALSLARELGITFVALIALWVGVGWFRAPSLPPQAPDFRLTDLDGKPWSLSELRGHTVVLNFWATWCGPCRMEAPTLSAFAAAHPDIPVLGIAVDGAPDTLRKVAGDIGITFPVLPSDEATRKAYGVSTLPTTVIVAPDGSVRAAHAGIMLGPHLALLTR